MRSIVLRSSSDSTSTRATSGRRRTRLRSCQVQSFQSSGVASGWKRARYAAERSESAGVAPGFGSGVVFEEFGGKGSVPRGACRARCERESSKRSLRTGPLRLLLYTDESFRLRPLGWAHVSAERRPVSRGFQARDAATDYEVGRHRMRAAWTGARRSWRSHSELVTGSYGSRMAHVPGLRQIGEAAFELAPGLRPDMRVPVRVFGSAALVEAMEEQVFVQAANGAALPGILEASLCMPDAHWGYGFPIGGVAAFDVESGVISPGGIGFDINCGMRLARTDLCWDELRPRLAALVDALAERVPAGAGREGFVHLSQRELRRVLRDGAAWAVRAGFGTAEDLATTESGGCFPGADPDCVSDRAVERGLSQLGTLGSGNHYLELQVLR